MRCSFEETVEILMEAATVSEKDDCNVLATGTPGQARRRVHAAIRRPSAAAEGHLFQNGPHCSPAPRYLPVNLQRIVQNAMQIFHIDRRKPSDLEPSYTIDSVRALCDRLVVVRGDDPLGEEA